MRSLSVISAITVGLTVLATLFLLSSHSSLQWFSGAKNQEVGPQTAFGMVGFTPASRVVLEVIQDTDLYRPLSLAFHPRDLSLWVFNHDNDSTVVLDGVLGERSKISRTIFYDRSRHFLRRPTAVAFSHFRAEFVTTQETTNDYGYLEHGNLFMGPTLWTSDREIFEGGNKSHWDMNHHSSLSMGVALGKNNQCREYWIFNGYNNSIDQYCFWKPHPLGGIDHKDGFTLRHAAGELRRLPNVPSHMQLDPKSNLLYVADTGNSRIVTLDTVKYDLDVKSRAEARIRETIVYENPLSHVEQLTGPDSGLIHPAGLILVDDEFLVVSDYGTGHLKTFSLDGSLIGETDTGLGPNSLAGIAAVPNGDGKLTGKGYLFAVDARRHRVLRITILPRGMKAPPVAPAIEPIADEPAPETPNGDPVPPADGDPVFSNQDDDDEDEHDPTETSP